MIGSPVGGGDGGENSDVVLEEMVELKAVFDDPLGKLTF